MLTLPLFSANNTPLGPAGCTWGPWKDKKAAALPNGCPGLASRRADTSVPSVLGCSKGGSNRWSTTTRKTNSSWQAAGRSAPRSCGREISAQMEQGFHSWLRSNITWPASTSDSSKRETGLHSRPRKGPARGLLMGKFGTVALTRSWCCSSEPPGNTEKSHYIVFVVWWLRALNLQWPLRMMRA